MMEALIDSQVMYNEKLISVAPLGLKCGTHIIETAYRIMYWKVKYT
jgi:hypothetical protein